MKAFFFITILFSLHSFAETATKGLILDPPPHFILNSQIQQCVAGLPTIGWMGFDHTWLVQNNQSFGMPYSLTHNAIQGGYASIRTPDPSLSSLTSDPVCQPIYQPENISQEKFAQKFSCLISKLTDSDEVLAPDWQPIFVYAWAVSNCHSSVRFILDCAGGAMSLYPNAGLGSHYSANEEMHVFQRNAKNAMDPELQNLQSIFSQFLQELESLNQNPNEIEKFLKDHSPAILAESAHQSKTLEKTRDLRQTGLYRRLQKFDLLFKKIIAQDPKAFSPDLLQKLKDLQDLFRSPDIVNRTYQQICEQAQKECS